LVWNKVTSKALPKLASALQQAMSSKSAGSGGRMLGANGTETTSTTVWGRENPNGTPRIDVENPDPGGRPGQIHYHDTGNREYRYDTVAKVFKDAPKRVNELLNRRDVQRAIQQAMKILGESK
jgi:hypothetical protein